MRRQKTAQSSNQFSHSLFLSLRNFVCKMTDEAELLMSLYDGKENAPFTESYVVRWSHANPLHSLRALFTVSINKTRLKEEIETGSSHRPTPYLASVYLCCYAPPSP